jgi:hypothetical protein
VWEDVLRVDVSANALKGAPYRWESSEKTE